MQQSIKLSNKETLKQCKSAIPVVVNKTCNSNSAILIEQNGKVQHSSRVT